MKKALLTIGFALSVIAAQAQDFRLGITGGLNSTWLLNQNVFDQNDGLDVASTFGGRFGIEGIYSFTEKVGFSLGVNFISGHNQKYTGDNNGPIKLNGDSKTMLKYIDVPLMFRLTSGNGSYFELGPQLGFLSSAKEDFKSDVNSAFDYSGKDVKFGFNSTNVAFVFGFGADIDVSESIYVTTGLRLGYGFTDSTIEFDSVDEYNNENKDNLENTSVYGANTNDKGVWDYQETNRAFAGLHLGVSYKFTK